MSFLKRNPNLALGLIPAIICMFFCISFTDAYVIYACTILSITTSIYVKAVKSIIFKPNIILLHTTLALVICTLIKLFTGNILIPDKSVPLTLLVMILCFSMVFIFFPKIYYPLIKETYYKVTILNQIANQMVVFFSLIYIIVGCIIYFIFQPMHIDNIFLLTHILPPIVYIVCIIVNYILTIVLIRNYGVMPIIRVIPIYEGKILVSPRIYSKFDIGKLDTPIEDYLFEHKPNANKRAKKISSLSLGIAASKLDPRFSLKYTLSIKGKKKNIILYILPLDENIHLKSKDYKLVSPEEILNNKSNYSIFLQEEIEHLQMVCSLWQNYHL